MSRDDIDNYYCFVYFVISIKMQGAVINLQRPALFFIFFIPPHCQIPWYKSNTILLIQLPPQLLIPGSLL